METEFLVTGAAGHLGINLLNELIKRKIKVKALIRENSSKEKYIPKNVKIVYGDVLNADDVNKFLAYDGYDHIVVHCAGIVSISSKYDENVYNTNVNGTKNIIDLSIKNHVKRFIYVSSVHAIQEKPKGVIISETTDFDPQKVHGLYAKTKATATNYVLKQKDKIEIVVVHPSGILGPFDYGHSHLVAMITDYCNGRLTAALKGGYDFVDARDVANGIVEAALKSKSGECYILSNKYYSIKEILTLASIIVKHKPIKTYLPLWFAKNTAFLSEIYYKIRKKPPLYTSYSLYTIESNSLFSHEKATRELNYNPRNMEETVESTIKFLKEIINIF